MRLRKKECLSLEKGTPNSENYYNKFFTKSNTLKELTEKQAQEVKKILDVFEGSLTIYPVIREEKQKDFKSAYAFIMQTYKLQKNVSLCVANILVNGIIDGWRQALPSVARECMRVCNGDMEKALSLMSLFLKNSGYKKRRIFADIKSALKWVKLDKKMSCEYISKHLPCIGKELCYKIRGIGSKAKGGDMELAQNQKALYLNRLLDYGYFLRLSNRAIKIYTFLLQKVFTSGFDILFITNRELGRGIGVKDLHISEYLKELAKENLIAYTPGKAGLGSKTANEIKVLDITGRAESRAEALFKEAFKN
jgi:hypothetical protein